jgi:glycosyltransferase involved in cell wall biosynthesis
VNRRVLYIIGSGAIGGRERQLLRLAGEVRDAGWEPGVAFISGGGPITDALIADGVAVWVPARPQQPATRAGAGPLRRRVRALASLASAVHTLRRARRDHRPNVVHAMLPMSVWLGLPVTARRGVPRVAGVYGFTPSMGRPIAFLYRHSLRHADAVIANAPHLVDEMAVEFGVSRDRLQLIANGVDLPALGSSDPDGPEPLDVVTAVVVANFHAYKGHADLLRALALLSSTSRPTVRLCGTGAERAALQHLAAELGVADQVVFVLPPADVPAELAHAQFAIHPSHTEGLSNAILEQLANGLPVIACRVGGNTELITDGVNGLLVPPADPAALAAAITALTTDRTRRNEMSAAARISAERFSWTACTQAHAHLYDALAAEAR